MSIIQFPRDDFVVSPDDVLDSAKGILKKCVIIGVEDNGDLYFASSHYEPEASLLLLRGNNFLIKISGDNE